MSSLEATASELGQLRKTRFLAFWVPIIILEVFLGVTVFLFFMGPIDWDIPNPLKLLTFLVVNYGGLWLGYRWGIVKAVEESRIPRRVDSETMQMPPYLIRLILISVLFTIANALIRLYVIRGGLTGAFSAFTDPGEAYREAHILAQLDRDGDLMAPVGQSWLFRFTTVFQVFNGLYYPIAMVCWRRLPKLHRALCFVALLSGIVFTVGIGAQSGIGQLLFGALPVGIYVMYVRGKRLSAGEARPAQERGRTLWRSIRTKLLIGAAASVLVVTVASFQLSREQDIGGELDATSVLVGNFGKPSNRGIIPVTGGAANFGIVAMVQYVSHGYEGLATAMELPFVPTYGLGWSKALQVIYRDYFGGPDLFDRSYLTRNEAQSGWPATFWWSTIFPWIASDTTFYGTVLFTILVGFVLGRIWSSVILTGNPMGFAVLAQLFTLIFMFPANNALAQTLDGLFSLVGVTVLYAMSWRYYRSIRPQPGAGLP